MAKFMFRLIAFQREGTPSCLKMVERGDGGDTLVEVLIALLVISLCGVALLTAFSTSITGSATYQNVAGGDVILRSASEAAYSSIQQSSTPLYAPCATPSTYSSIAYPTWPTGYSAAITSVDNWSGSGVTNPPTCTPGNVLFEVVTVTLTTPKGLPTLVATFTVDGQ